jgi:hypothetical protein
MKLKIMLTENYSQRHVVYIPDRNVFFVFQIQGPHIVAGTLSDFGQSVLLA